MVPGGSRAHHCVCGVRESYGSPQTSQELRAREDLSCEGPSLERLNDKHRLLQLSVEPFLHLFSSLLNKTELENQWACWRNGSACWKWVGVMLNPLIILEGMTQNAVKIIYSLLIAIFSYAFTTANAATCLGHKLL